MRVQRALSKFKLNAFSKKAQNLYKSNLILQKLKTSISNLRSIYGGFLLKKQLSLFAVWRAKTSRLKQEDKLASKTKEISVLQKKHSSEIDKFKKKGDEAERKAKDMVKELNLLRETETKLQSAIRDKEDKEKVYKDYIDKLKKKNVSCGF